MNDKRKKQIAEYLKNIYVAEAQGNEQVEKILERLDDLRDERNQLIGAQLILQEMEQGTSEELHLDPDALESENKSVATPRE